MVLITKELIRKKAEHNECLITTLEELSLHQEDIEKIEHLHNWSRNLKILLLQSNLIPKIENLYKLKKLEYLNLALNNIERVENLEQLESLNKLDLTINFIGELTSIESLRDNYNLKELILTGNPCCDYPHYREYVIATLPQLQNLDCKEIKISDKLKVQNKLNEYRSQIIQKQAAYAMDRDEQKIRVLQQQVEFEEKVSHIDDEHERMKEFWNTKSEHCPEVRNEIARYQKMSREKENKDDVPPVSKGPHLFAPCGRPYNLNQAKLHFSFKDEDNEYILELDAYRYLDTSLIKVDVEKNYIRATIKHKIFQIHLHEEVKTSAAIVQRSETTGKLLIKVPKLNFKNVLQFHQGKNPKSPQENNKGVRKLKGPVNIRNICSTNDDDVPDLI